MVDRFFKIVVLDPKSKKVKMHDCPSYQIPNKETNGKHCKKKRSYISAVGCLSYIQAMIRPYITMEVKQCTIFFNDPSQEHEKSVNSICRYLLKKKLQGINSRPDKERVIIIG